MCYNILVTQIAYYFLPVGEYLGKRCFLSGYILAGRMQLCDNNEGFHFFGVSLLGHTFLFCEDIL